MEILSLSHDEIDFKKWDHCIADAPNGNLYAWSWYLNCLGQWKALVTEDYSYCLPFFTNKKLFGIEQVYQPFFCQQHGLFSTQEITKDILNTFLKKLSKYNYVHLNLNEDNSKIGLDFSFVKRNNHKLSLEPSYENLQKGYSKSLRKRIRKAQTLHRGIRTDFEPAFLVDFYKKNIGHKTNIQDYTTIYKILVSALEKQQGQIIGIDTNEGELGAVGFFGESHQRIYNIFGASSDIGRESFSMHLLLDSIIKNNAQSSKTLDFEGSNIPNIAQFFESFGAEITTYHQVEINNLPFPINLLKKS